MTPAQIRAWLVAHVAAHPAEFAVVQERVTRQVERVQAEGGL